MIEITDQTTQVDPKLLSVPEIHEAIQLTEEASYTPAELEAYQSYWKAVSSDRTLQSESMFKGREQGRAEGKSEATLKIARELKQKGVAISTIMDCTNLSEEEVRRF